MVVSISSTALSRLLFTPPRAQRGVSAAQSCRSQWSEASEGMGRPLGYFLDLPLFHVAANPALVFQPCPSCSIEAGPNPWKRPFAWKRLLGVPPSRNFAKMFFR